MLFNSIKKEKLSKLAYDFLAYFKKYPSKPISINILYELQCKAMSYLLLGKDAEAKNYMQKLLNKWIEFTSHREMIDKLFVFSEKYPGTSEENNWMATILSDGIMTAIASNQRQLIQQMQEVNLTVIDIEISKNEGTSKHVMEQEHHLFLLYNNEYQKSIDERKTFIESLLEDEILIFYNSSIWKGIIAIAENDILGLDCVIKDRLEFDYKQSLSITERKNLSCLPYNIWPGWILNTVPAAMLRLGNLRGMSFDASEYLQPEIIKLWDI